MNVPRLIIAIISNIFWEALIAAAAVWLLPLLGVKIPAWVIVLIMVAFAIYAFFMYRVGSRILKKKILPGSTDMIGVKGIVAKRLDPSGYVSVEGELWEAKTESGAVEPGTSVVVIGQSGLTLIVKAVK